MATTVEAARLTETHRLAQVRLGKLTVLQVRSLWPLLDPTALDATFPSWLRTVTPIVQAQRSASAQLAGRYLTAFRTLEVDAEPFAPVLADPAPARALTTSMLVTGPVSIKSAVKSGVPFALAVDTADVRAARAAMRHALAGGRETILHSVRSDTRARGWQRVTSAKPCEFCAMLAGRGTVYTEESADFAAHDGCSCAAEPAY